MEDGYLKFWGDVFLSANLAAAMPFSEFTTAPPRKLIEATGRMAAAQSGRPLTATQLANLVRDLPDGDWSAAAAAGVAEHAHHDKMVRRYQGNGRDNG